MFRLDLRGIGDPVRQKTRLLVRQLLKGLSRSSHQSMGQKHFGKGCAKYIKIVPTDSHKPKKHSPHAEAVELAERRSPGRGREAVLLPFSESCGHPPAPARSV